MRRHLRAISSEEPSCTFVTSSGTRVEVENFIVFFPSFCKTRILNFFEHIGATISLGCCQSFPRLPPLSGIPVPLHFSIYFHVHICYPHFPGRQLPMHLPPLLLLLPPLLPHHLPGQRAGLWGGAAGVGFSPWHQQLQSNDQK